MNYVDSSAMMDKNRDLRRTAAISTVAGLPRRRQRVTTFRDSADDNRQMELKETVRLRDREQLQKKDRDRGFPKRRRVDSNRIGHSSNEQCFEDDEETRTDQLPSGYSSLSNNRRGFRTALRSSPALRTDVDEVLGVPIPRRARSASSKKLLEFRDSGSGGFGEDLKRRKSTLSTGSPIGSGGASPPHSGFSMKKKMRYVASKSNSPSLGQDDIEIEVAEALFDLLTQSHSRPRMSVGEEKAYKDGTNTLDDGELKRLKDGLGEVEKDTYKVQNKESINADTEMNNKGGEKDKFGDEPARESVSGDGFVDTRKARSPKEGESSSCVKGNACDIKDPTVTKGEYAAIVVDANNKKEAGIVFDLMELPSLPSSPGRDAMLDTDLKVMTHDAQKKTEATPKIGVLSDSRLSILKLENKPRHDDIPSVDDSTCQQPQGWKETNIQSPTSLLSFPIGMGSWPCVLPHAGYMTSLSARSSMTMQPPQFKFVQPRTKRCSTHRLVADSIHHHQQLVTKSLSSSSGPTIGCGVATLYGTNQFSLKSMLPTHRLPHGKEKSSNVNASVDFNTTTGSPALLQQVKNQAPAQNFLQQNSGFSFAVGHQLTAMNAPTNSLCGSPQSASSRKLPANSTFPEASATPMTFNQYHPFLPSNEDATSYMSILQNGGRPIPIPTNISLPSFKGGPSFLNSSFYSQPMFNVAQIQHPPSQKSHTPTSDTKLLQQPEKNSNNNAHAYSYHVGNGKPSDIPHQGGSKNRVELAPQHFPLPFGSNMSSLTKNSAIFQMLPKVSEVKSQTDPKSENPFLANFYLQQQHQMQQQQLLKGGSSSAVQTDYSSFFPKWDNFPRSGSTAQVGLSHPSRVNSTQLNIPQGQNRNSTSSVQGHHPVVSNSQPVVVSSLRNNSSTQGTEGSSGNGGSTPACRRVVPSILSSCASQLSEIKYG